jgi:hypothetical protein
MVAFGSGASLASGVPSSKQKFRERSAYVRLQVGQRFIVAVRSLSSSGGKAKIIGHISFDISHLSFWYWSSVNSEK